MLLLELVFQNQTSNVIDNEFLNLVQVVQPAVAVLQEGMHFLVVDVGNDDLLAKESDGKKKDKGDEKSTNSDTNNNNNNGNNNNTSSNTNTSDNNQQNGHPSAEDRTVDAVATMHRGRTTSRKSILTGSSPLAPTTTPQTPLLTPLTASAPSPTQPIIVSESQLIRAAKQHLRLTLSVLDPVCGPIGHPLEELLLLQCGRNLSFDAHVMEAHVSEAGKKK